jgi:hypothetical protein
VSDKDGEIKFALQNIKGLYMPDSIESYDANGQTYFVTANEGDFREDDGDAVRAGKLGLAAPLDRINVSSTDSTADDLFIPGARSFSIFDENGNLAFDSGNRLEVEAAKFGIYNDGRSDNKGVEPEGMAILDLLGSTYAFIGLERTTKSAIAVYDITNPFQSLFLTMLISDDDLSPEGLEAFTTQGKAYLAFSNEKSNTTSLYSLSVSEVPIPAAAFLFAPTLIGFLGLRSKAKNAIA